MKLFDFQEQAVRDIVSFISKANALKEIGSGLIKDPYQAAWDAKHSLYTPLISKTGESVPNGCVVVPTGGGKTVIGLSTVAELSKSVFTNTRICLWLVPNDALNKQFYGRVVDSDFYNVKSLFGSKSFSFKKTSDSFSYSDLSANHLIIIPTTYQSVIRSEKSRDINIFKPRNELRFINSIPGYSNHLPSFFEFLKLSKPLIVVDESHRSYTELGRGFISELDPCFILELTATPKSYTSNDGEKINPNIVFSAAAQDLVNNQLIKQPINYKSLTGFSSKEVLTQVVNQIEIIKQEVQSQGLPIIPKALISVEFTGKRQAHKELSAQNVKDLLIEIGVKSEDILIESHELSEVSSISDVDSLTNKASYFITKRALMEGWDCKSLYVIALLNNIGAQITNFQIVGRGLRQPLQCYFNKKILNTLFVFSNSSKHDVSIQKLRGFLEDCGLSDSSLVSESSSKSDGALCEFTLTSSKFNKLVPEVGYKNPKEVKKDFRLKLFSFLTQLTPFKRDAGFDSIDDKGVKSSVLALTSNSYRSEPWQFVSFDTNLPCSEEAIAYALAKSIFSVFPSSYAAYHFARNQVASLISDGMSASDIASKIIPISELLLQLLRSSSNSFQAKYFIDQVASGGIFIKLGKSTPLPESVKYSVLPEDRSLPPFTKNIYGNVPKTIFNSQELDFARTIDSLPIMGWLRNDPFQTEFYIDVFSTRFYPDFIVFSKDSPKILVVVIETKGAHLKDSEDTKKKEAVFNALNSSSNDEIEFVIGTFDFCLSKIKPLLVI